MITTNNLWFKITTIYTSTPERLQTTTAILNYTISKYQLSQQSTTPPIELLQQNQMQFYPKQTSTNTHSAARNLFKYKLKVKNSNLDKPGISGWCGSKSLELGDLVVRRLGSRAVNGMFVEMSVVRRNGNVIRVLIHIDVVLDNGSHDEFITLNLHPSSDKGSQVEPWSTIQHELIVYELECSVLGYSLLSGILHLGTGSCTYRDANVEFNWISPFRFELDAILNIIKEVEALNVNEFGYEETYSSLTSQLCDLESGEDYLLRVESCIEVSTRRHKEEIQVEVVLNKTDGK
ncbi:hypothetical protein F8388_003467 [Cannabis sativa]|uniref:Uncharacterized protein n=1 Tax=Cannabis sativa TaxID=3483 RepID=A0A7J6F5B6_CANSA|nr:hypothetical protein F8388_003467 [Cannabis sativa]